MVAFMGWLTLAMPSAPGTLELPPGLEMVLSLTEEGFLLGDPLPIQVAFRNTTDAPLDLTRFLEPAAHFLRFEEPTLFGGILEYRPWFETTPAFEGDLNFLTLPPGESYQTTLDLTFQAGEPGEGQQVCRTLSRAGSFTLRAVYEIPPAGVQGAALPPTLYQQRVESNFIPLTVHEPKPKGQLPPTARAEIPGPTGPLRLSLSLGKESLLLGEPFSATVTLQNVGPGPLRITRLLEPGAGVLSFEEISLFGGIIPYQPRVQITPNWDSPYATVLLEPGQTYTQEEDLTFHLFGTKEGQVARTLAYPGKFTFQAAYECPGVLPEAYMPRTVSNPVTLEVHEPQGMDAEVYQAYIAPGAASQEDQELFWGTGVDPGYQTMYQSLLAEYPTSSYAQYTRFFLAECYEFNRAYDQAIQTCQTILQKPWMLYTDQAWIMQGRCYFKKGDLNKASAIFREMAEAPVPDSAKWQAQQWIKRLEEAWQKKDRPNVK